MLPRTVCWLRSNDFEHHEGDGNVTLMARFSECIPTGKDDLSRQKIACVVLLGLLFLPYINKAIHIDDIAFLRFGDFFGWNPLQAFPQDYFYRGEVETNLSPYVVTHPLLIPYLLKALQSLFGTAEIWLHLAFLFFPALALWSLARLDDALGVTAGKGSYSILLLFGSLPAFVVNGQNLMTDVPTLAFLLAGTTVFAKCVHEHSSGSPWRGSFWLSCAVFSSYQALAFIPVLLWFVVAGIREARRRYQVIGALLLPALLMFVWLILIYLDHGIFPLLKSQAQSSVVNEIRPGLHWRMFWEKAIFVFAMTGASLLFVLPVRFCLTQSWNSKFDCFLLLALTIAFFLVIPGESGIVPQRIALAILGALGLFGLGLAFLCIKSWYTHAETRAIAILCGGWIGITLLFNVFALPFGSARYLLPIFPILFIVLLRGRDETACRFPRLATILLLGSLLWGGANAWADYNYAGTYRAMAAELAEFRQSLRPGQRIWYIGEWGMRHYFDQAGAHYLLADSTEPKTGDFLVIPEMPRFWAPSPLLRPRLNFYASREFRSPVPLRLFNRRGGAGFYCHHWGMLPFAFSSEPDEVFIIQEVR